MKRIFNIILCVSIFAVLTSCGDNKKTRIPGLGFGVPTGVSSTGNSAVDAAVYSAGLAAKGVGPVSAIPAPAAMAMGVSNVAIPGWLTTPDGEGYYTYPDTTSSIRIRFKNANGDVVTPISSFVTIEVVVVTEYTFGIFTGNFSIDRSTPGDEVMTGTITSQDPVGSTFTAVLSNVRMDYVTISNAPFGIPKSGSMSLTSDAGYTGTFTYSKSGSSHKCDGDIIYSSSVVASVYLTYDQIFGNYAGYYTDADGQTFLIQ